MRLLFSLTPNRELVDFNYNHVLVGVLHRWLGKNDLHDKISLYSVGSLQGGGARNGALSFPRGASWHISAPDTPTGQDFLAKIAEAALRSPQMNWGMEIAEISSQSTPEFGPRRVFRADSPIFIRGEKLEDSKDPHILYNDPRANDYLTKTLRHKLDAAGLKHLSETATVAFDRSYPSPKTRLIHIKDDFYKKASVCPVIVTGEPDAVRFAWNVGAGNLTGSGFGSLA